MHCRYCNKKINSDLSFCSDECKKAHWAKAEKKTTNIKLIQKKLEQISETLIPIKKEPQKEEKEENWQSTLFMYK